MFLINCFNEILVRQVQINKKKKIINKKYENIEFLCNLKKHFFIFFCPFSLKGNKLLELFCSRPGVALIIYHRKRVWPDCSITTTKKRGIAATRLLSEFTIIKIYQHISLHDCGQHLFLHKMMEWNNNNRK